MMGTLMKSAFYKRLSIAAAGGNTVCVTQCAESLSAALDEEINYYLRAGRIPAQINISEER